MTLSEIMDQLGYKDNLSLGGHKYSNWKNYTHFDEEKRVLVSAHFLLINYMSDLMKNTGRRLDDLKTYKIIHDDYVEYSIYSESKGEIELENARLQRLAELDKRKNQW